jgi:predicted RNase H-like HicB family nuclease
MDLKSRTPRSRIPEVLSVKSYIVPIVVEPDEDVWRAYAPELEGNGAATSGRTRDEALQNIQDVTQMVIEAMVEDGEPLPSSVAESEQPVVAATLA